MGKVVAVVNQKGGVGKTTTVVNLAAALVEKKYKILIVDIDPQGNATSGCGVLKNQTKSTIYDILVNFLLPLEYLIVNVYSPSTKSSLQIVTIY